MSSPAIDAGNADTCANPPVAGVDQRGVTRPLGTACDIGAVEVATSPKQISVAVSGLGSVSASEFPTPIRGRIADCTDSGGSQCSALYPQDFPLQLHASAAAHWHFSGWVAIAAAPRRTSASHRISTGTALPASSSTATPSQARSADLPAVVWCCRTMQLTTWRCPPTAASNSTRRGIRQCL